MGVVEPSSKVFDAAFGLGPIGHFRGDVGQLRALAAHNAADESRQSVEVAGEVACGLSRIGLREGVADGTIAAKGPRSRDRPLSATQHPPTTSLIGISWHCNEP